MWVTDTSRDESTLRDVIQTGRRAEGGDDLKARARGATGTGTARLGGERLLSHHLPWRDRGWLLLRSPIFSSHLIA